MGTRTGTRTIALTARVACQGSRASPEPARRLASPHGRRVDYLAALAAALIVKLGGPAAASPSRASSWWSSSCLVRCASSAMRPWCSSSQPCAPPRRARARHAARGRERRDNRGAPRVDVGRRAGRGRGARHDPRADPGAGARAAEHVRRTLEVDWVTVQADAPTPSLARRARPNHSRRLKSRTRVAARRAPLALVVDAELTRTGTATTPGTGRASAPSGTRGRLRNTRCASRWCNGPRRSCGGVLQSRRGTGAAGRCRPPHMGVARAVRLRPRVDHTGALGCSTSLRHTGDRTCTAARRCPPRRGSRSGVGRWRSSRRPAWACRRRARIACRTRRASWRRSRRGTGRRRRRGRPRTR